ncbi:hypothetical protein Aduo_001812 [Ancylostoma duodenale]
MSVPVQDTMHVILGCIRIVVSAVAGREAPSTEEKARPATSHPTGGSFEEEARARLPTWQPPGDSNEQGGFRLPTRQPPGHSNEEKAGFRFVQPLKTHF